MQPISILSIKFPDTLAAILILTFTPFLLSKYEFLGLGSVEGPGAAGAARGCDVRARTHSLTRAHTITTALLLRTLAIKFWQEDLIIFAVPQPPRTSNPM